MLNKILGFTLTALPTIAGFAVYALAQDKGIKPLPSAALAGAAFAAADIGGQLLSGGGISGLTVENVGILLNSRAPAIPALTRAQRSNLGYLVPQSVGACFGQC